MNQVKCQAAIGWTTAALIAVLVASGLTEVSHAQTKATLPPYKDASLPIAKRVDDLVSRMTLTEKIHQMEYTSPEITRLGVPSYNWWGEALHGVARSGYATVFPQAIGMAATWDEALLHQEGETIATEARAKYNQAQREGNHAIFYGLDFWSPNINIFRDPRWGRGQETYGEDPFLTGKLGSAFVTGVQGNDPKYLKAVATPKHYAVHSGPEPLRHGFNVNVSPHDFEDTYLPAFRATIVEAHADSIMCAYNAVDGVPACASKMLLQETLRDAWKFQGYVTSDCAAVGNISEGHHYTPDNKHGAALAVLAGTDTTCGHEYGALLEAVQDGLIKESEIDIGLKRLFTARMRLGMFDPPEAVAFNRIPFSENDSPQHRALALKAARESMVLLKNHDGILPLKSNFKTIAVIGPDAESLVTLEGNYNGVPSHPVYPLDGIRKVFAGKAKVLYSQGSPFLAQLALPVPSTVFHTAEGAGTPGLKAEYFSNPNFSGKPTLTRVDPRIQFDWNSAAPAPGVNMQAFSVRWTGTLTPLRGSLWRVKHRAATDSGDPLDHGAGLVWLSPALPAMGKDAQRVIAIAGPFFARYGFDLLATFTMINERAMVGILNVAFDQADMEESGRAAACYHDAMNALVREGYPPYRVGLGGFGMIAGPDDTFWQVATALKRALDPNDIIAPGRYIPRL